MSEQQTPSQENILIVISQNPDGGLLIQTNNQVPLHSLIGALEITSMSLKEKSSKAV